MTQRQIKCSYCDNGQEILYDRDASPKTTNLDGSYHRHVKYGSQEKPHQETVVVNQPTNPTPEYEAKITAGLRSEAIATAHKENMAEGEKLRASIDNLKVTADDVSTQIYNLNKTLSTFNDMFRTYLDTLNNQLQP